MTPADLERIVIEKMEKISGSTIHATVEVAEYRPIFVSGYVANPGSFPWMPDMTILNAQALAGGLKTKVEYVGLERPMHRVDVMVNRLAFALVVAAIIVSSAVMFSSEAVTQLIGVPLSVAYVVLGVLMAGWLLYSILRSGRL